MTDLRKAATEVTPQVTPQVTPEVTGEVTGDVDETAKGEQEPVCFLRETSWSYEIAPWDDPNGIPVYIAPPKKKWIGLTDQEFESILEQHNEAFPFAVYQSIEAKLKEKNT
jgi:hypothetical protein